MSEDLATAARIDMLKTHRDILVAHDAPEVVINWIDQAIAEHQAKLDQPSWFCPACGTKNPDPVKICQHCDRDVSKDEIVMVTPPTA